MQKKVGAWSGGKSWSAERRCQKGSERGAAMQKRVGARSGVYPWPPSVTWPERLFEWVTLLNLQLISGLNDVALQFIIQKMFVF